MYWLVKWIVPKLWGTSDHTAWLKTIPLISHPSFSLYWLHAQAAHSLSHKVHYSIVHSFHSGYVHDLKEAAVFLHTAAETRAKDDRSSLIALLIVWTPWQTYSTVVAQIEIQEIRVSHCKYYLDYTAVQIGEIISFGTKVAILVAHSRDTKVYITCILFRSCLFYAEQVYSSPWQNPSKTKSSSFPGGGKNARA